MQSMRYTELHFLNVQVLGCFSRLLQLPMFFCEIIKMQMHAHKRERADAFMIVSRKNAATAALTRFY